MIEGLWAAPWFHEFARRKQLGIDDCGRCMQSQPELARQSLGCGYTPPADGKVRLNVWQPPSGARGYKGPELTVCAGYTVNLPEITEVAKARLHWKSGALGHACDGDIASEDLLDAILVFDASCNALEGWLMTPSKDGGGGA